MIDEVRRPRGLFTKDAFRRHRQTVRGDLDRAAQLRRAHSGPGRIVLYLLHAQVTRVRVQVTLVGQQLKMERRQVGLTGDVVVEVDDRRLSALRRWDEIV